MKLVIDIPKEKYEAIKDKYDTFPAEWKEWGLEAIKNGKALGIEKKPKWIPVSERLPASDEDVLVTNGIGIYVGWIDITDKRWRVDSENEYFMYDIVAWMPLPKVYKESEE